MASAAWLDTQDVHSCAAAGMYHSAALTETLSVISFGSNHKGQLGIGKDKAMREVPTYVWDPRAADSQDPSWRNAPIQIACGALHSVLLLANGELYVWGLADGGRLGIGSIASDGATSFSVSHLPVPVPHFTAQTRVVQVACGTDHTLCVDQDGDVWSWGIGSYGNLGHGSNKNEQSPRAVEALRGKAMRMVAGGAKHSACVSVKGEVYTWGHGDKGRLGNGAQRGTSVPESVDALQHEFCVFVDCGEANSAAISDGGELWTWGAGGYGRLGHGEESDAFLPVKVEALVGNQIVHVSLGVFHSVAVAKSGALWAWGGAQYGKLGFDTSANMLSPHIIPATSFDNNPVVQAFAGVSHTMAICSNGTMYTWGDPMQGKLGRPLPATATLGPSVSRAATSASSVPAAILLQGALHGVRVAPTKAGLALPAHGGTAQERGGGAGGNPAAGKALGLGGARGGAPSSVPRSLDAGSNAVSHVAVGAKHSLVLTFNGAVFAWGGNEFGQIGNGSREDARMPVRVKFSSSTTQRVTHLAAGANHSLCCLNQGDLYAWGRGNEAQIGTGSTITETSPILVQGLQGQRVTKVFGGECHSAAVTDEGRLFTWGDPDQGKLGQGRARTEADAHLDSLALPCAVEGHLATVEVVDVSLGANHSACVDNLGKVYTWGAGWQGKLGLGTTENQYTPQRVLALQFLNIRSVSCGAYHTLFVTNDGDLYACGRGDARLGLGETTDKLVPELNATLRAAGADVVFACAAEEHSLAVTLDGRVWTWGKDAYAKLGLGRRHGTVRKGGGDAVEMEALPRVIDASTLSLNNDRYGGRDDIRKVAAFANHCLALAQDSRVYAWGSNGNGRLGLEENGTARIPKVVDTPRLVPHFQQRLQHLSRGGYTQPGQVAGENGSAGGADSSSAAAFALPPRGKGAEVTDVETASASAALLASARNGSTAVRGAGESMAASLGILGATAAASTTSKHLGNDAAALEAHIRDYMENGKVPPLYIVQLFLKAEPKERQAQTILVDNRERADAEDALYRTLLALIRAERQVQRLDYTIGLTVASTMRRLNLPGTGGGPGGGVGPGNAAPALGPSDRSKMSAFASARPRPSAKHSPMLTRELAAHIPAYEKIFVLLLANPRYLINLYKVYVAQQQQQQLEARAQMRSTRVQDERGAQVERDETSKDAGGMLVSLPQGPDWRELYFELVESVYVFGDPHCDHLALVLARSVLRQELEAFMGAMSVRAAMATEEAWNHGDSGANSEYFGQFREQGRDAQGRKTLRSFLDDSRTQSGSFVELASRFFAQDTVTKWLRDSFQAILIDLYRGHRSRTAMGRELRLNLDPIKIYNELQGNEDDASLPMNSARAAQVREEYAGYPDVRHELDTRLSLLREITLMFLNQISKVAASIPREVRLFCRVYHEELQRHFEFDMEASPIRYDQAVAKFVLDHLLRPAFLAPKQRHLVPRHFDPITPQQHQNMLQIVKLLQAIMCDRPYRKERLEPLNVAIRQHHVQVQSMVNDVLNVPSTLDDVLYTDVIMEYLRPRGDPLRLRVAKRSLRFVRFALHHASARIICSEEDPLARVASESGGILSRPTDRIGAESFAQEVVLLREEDNFKVNIAVEMRFLDLDPEAEEAAARRRSLGFVPEYEAQGQKLRAGLLVDPVSRVPVPAWMLEHDMKAVSTLEDLDLGQTTTDVENFRSELVDLPELPQTGDWSAFRENLGTRLDDEVRRCDFERAAGLHRVISRLNELELSLGPEAKDGVLRQLLTSLLQRRKAAFRLHHQLAEARQLGKKAAARLEALEVERVALEEYMQFLRTRPSLSGPAEGSRGADAPSQDSFFYPLLDQDPQQNKFKAANGARGPERDGGDAQARAARRRSSAGSTGGLKRPSSAGRLRAAIVAADVPVGAYMEFTLARLLEQGVVTQVSRAAAYSDDVGGGSGRSGKSAERQRQQLRRAEALGGLGAEAFAKNKTSIKLQFYSKDTGVFTVFVLLRPDTLLDTFEISMPRLMEMERVLKQTFHPSAKLPFEFSVLQVKILLEEITMKMLQIR